MLDSERALESIEATHPVVAIVTNDNVREIQLFIPTGISSMELEDKEVLTIEVGYDMDGEEYEEFTSILIDDAGYVQLPSMGQDFLNKFVDHSNFI